MFLHLGGDVIVPIRDVVGIFDLSAGAASINSEFLATAGEEGFVLDLIPGEKKSFVLVNEQVYLSPIASSTLRKRWEEGNSSL
ncbi:MAG: extracellular matrix regulator RemB [Bacillota bacterium]|jgi:hypothetical protein